MVTTPDRSVLPLHTATGFCSFFFLLPKPQNHFWSRKAQNIQSLRVRLCYHSSKLEHFLQFVHFIHKTNLKFLKNKRFKKPDFHQTISENCIIAINR